MPARRPRGRSPMLDGWASSWLRSKNEYSYKYVPREKNTIAKNIFLCLLRQVRHGNESGTTSHSVAERLKRCGLRAEGNLPPVPTKMS